MVTDLFIGSALSEVIPQYGSFSEVTTAYIFMQMCEAIGYCNSKGLFHNNLTPESFIFLGNNVRSPLILVDIGCSCMVKIGYLLL